MGPTTLPSRVSSTSSASSVSVCVPAARRDVRALTYAQLVAASCSSDAGLEYLPPGAPSRPPGGSSAGVGPHPSASRSPALCAGPCHPGGGCQCTPPGCDEGARGPAPGRHGVCRPCRSSSPPPCSARAQSAGNRPPTGPLRCRAAGIVLGRRGGARQLEPARRHGRVEPEVVYHKVALGCRGTSNRSRR